jgi:fatty acid desaturase
MKVDLRSRPRGVSFVLGAIVGAAFILRPHWIGFVVGAIAVLVLGTMWPTDKRVSISLLFATGILVGLVGPYVLLLGHWYYYCEHHVGSDQCA